MDGPAPNPDIPENLRRRIDELEQELARLRQDPLDWLAAASTAAASPLPPVSPPVERLISVIVPLYNGAAYIGRCLDSIANQQPCGYDLEVLVCDDGSHDDSIAAARAWAEAHPSLPVRLLTHPDAGNHGVSATRNRCATHASGAFLALLDADDLWLPSKLATQMRYLEQHPETTCVCSFGLNRDLAGLPIPGWSKTRYAGDFRQAPPPENFRAPYDFDQLLQGDPVLNSSALIRRTAFDQAGGYPATMSHQAEDWLLFLKLSLAAPIHLIPEPLIQYSVHSESYTAEYVRQGFAFGSRLEVLLFLLHWMLPHPQHRARAQQVYRRNYATLLAGMGGALRLAESFHLAHPDTAPSLAAFEQHLQQLYQRLDELEHYHNHIESQLNLLRRLPGLKFLYNAARRLRGSAG
ncbi:MAG: glycosyltransferase family 2 protein [Bryobacteraceae bacterium]|nr:glycosyltransferase family 2 protein [Solibacteraceae bacterium]MCO5353573.1 glycosyltransferase family 2 protein [Bryobacteraceae bacterium]